MVAARPQEADRLVARPPRDVAFYLVYGPDTGLVSERARTIAAAFAIAASATAPGRPVTRAGLPAKRRRPSSKGPDGRPLS